VLAGPKARLACEITQKSQLYLIQLTEY